MLGWGRQLALTKQRPLGFVANKVAVALVLGALSSSLVFIVGALTGAKADAWWVWVASWAIGILGAGLFGVYGLAMGLLLKSESAAGVASGTVVFLAFLGNMFMPLTGAMLDIARFTPMYGYVGLVRYPQVEGEIQQTDPLQTDSIWLLVANYLAWLLVFSGLAVLGQRRSRKRQ
jgi:putative ABC drug resistance transporter, inner membrane subunit